MRAHEIKKNSTSRIDQGADSSNTTGCHSHAVLRLPMSPVQTETREQRGWSIWTALQCFPRALAHRQPRLYLPLNKRLSCAQTESAVAKVFTDISSNSGLPIRYPELYGRLETYNSKLKGTYDPSFIQVKSLDRYSQGHTKLINSMLALILCE